MSHGSVARYKYFTVFSPQGEKHTNKHAVVLDTRYCLRFNSVHTSVEYTSKVVIDCLAVNQHHGIGQ